VYIYFASGHAADIISEDWLAPSQDNTPGWRDVTTTF